MRSRPSPLACRSLTISRPLLLWQTRFPTPLVIRCALRYLVIVSPPLFSHPHYSSPRSPLRCSRDETQRLGCREKICIKFVIFSSLFRRRFGGRDGPSRFWIYFAHFALYTVWGIMIIFTCLGNSTGPTFPILHLPLLYVFVFKFFAHGFFQSFSQFIRTCVNTLNTFEVFTLFHHRCGLARCFYDLCVW